MSAGVCKITIENQTPVALTYDKAHSQLNGVLSDDSPATVPDNATRVYKIIPFVGKTASEGQFIFKINDAHAITVELKCEEIMMSLETESKLASVTVKGEIHGIDEGVLICTVIVKQATEEEKGGTGQE